MEYKYLKLRGRIVEKFGTIDAFCEKLNISKTQASKKLNCKAGFSQADIVEWCDILDIPLTEVGVFFYA